MCSIYLENTYVLGSCIQTLFAVIRYRLFFYMLFIPAEFYRSMSQIGYFKVQTFIAKLVEKVGLG